MRMRDQYGYVSTILTLVLHVASKRLIHLIGTLGAMSSAAPRFDQLARICSAEGARGKRMVQKHRWLRAFTIVSVAAFISFGAAAGPIISVGTPITNDADVPSYLTDGSYLFGITVPSLVPPDDFLLPVDISGASKLQSWQFTLLFDNTVVQEVDPGDGSSGIYGAEFTPGDLNSLSFILSGFPFNFLGEVDTVAGEYPSLLTGPSGDGVLAFILFHFIPGEEENNPNFSITGTTVVQGAPEPATLALVLGGLAALGGRRLAKRARRN